MRKVVLPEADDETDVVAADVEVGRALWRVLDESTHIGRRALLQQRFELARETLRARCGCGVPLAKREQLLKLVQHDQGPDQAIARPPELGVSPMEVGPQRVIRQGLGRLDAGRLASSRKGLQDLHRQLRRVRTQVEADPHGQMVAGLEGGEDTGPQQRGLAQARLAVKHHDIRAADEVDQRAGLVLAAEEVGGVGF